MRSTVALVKCDDYDQAKVDASIKKALTLLGGLAQFVKPGQRVLIKPNLLMKSRPERAITTHPSIVSAVVREVAALGAAALVGDSPGNVNANIRQVWDETGIKNAVEQAGGKMVTFQQDGIKETKSPSPSASMPILNLSRLVLEADVIINLPKLKTHNLTAFTGAIKNMFGAIPGFYKTKFHQKAPNPKIFAGLIVDVYQAAQPALNIFDAVVGMEGPGPANGNPRKLGAIIASADGVAADAAASYLIGFDPLKVDIIRIAYQRKLGEADLKSIQILGAEIGRLRQKEWKHPSGLSNLYRFLPGFLFDLLHPLLNTINVDPQVNPGKCTKCLVCVKNCPANTINYCPDTKVVAIDLKNCIHCLCCHELCEYDAIKLKSSWLARRLGVGQ